MNRMSRLRLAAMALTSLLAVAAAPAPAPVYKEFGDWIVACDNLRRCSAHAVPNPDTDTAKATTQLAAQGDASLAITRDGGGASLPVLAYDGEHAAGPVAVAIDGQAVPEATPWTVRDVGGDKVASLTGAPAAALLRRMRDGAVLTLSSQGSPVPFSLNGLGATLLLFDDVQGRIGTVTGLARPGPQPADTVPSAPPLPVLRAAPPASPLRNAKAYAASVRRAKAASLQRHECDGPPEDDQALPLTADEALVILVCNRAAYQEASLVFRGPRDVPAQARLVTLPHPPGYPRARPDPVGDDQVTEASYDPATATLSESAKGRGLADCGLSLAWVFDGRDFRPSAYAYQDRCGGQPGDWPVLFRTRSAR